MAQHMFTEPEAEYRVERVLMAMHCRKKLSPSNAHLLRVIACV
jgi:hypothetical protein